jgi:hypothetical protein
MKGWHIYLSVFSSLVLRGLVVPMLEVLIDSSSLGDLVLLQQCPETSFSIGRVLVHGLVEGSVARMVLVFELGGSHVKCKRVL